MSFDDRSFRSSKALRPLLGDLESTLRKSMKNHDALFRTAHTDVKDDNEDASAWAQILNRENGEDEDDELHAKPGQRTLQQ